MTLSDSVYERLLQQRIIVLGQQVDDDIANRIAAQMLLLSAEDPHADIALYINSPGGSVTAGMAIFDTMEFIECDVATYAMGLAASMGQFLLSAARAASASRCRTARSSCTSRPRVSVAPSRTSPSRRSCSAGTSVRCRADREPHRPDRREDHGRLRPRPLVLRAGGPRVRLRRPRDLAGRAAARRRRGKRERECQVSRFEMPSSRYVLPSFVERTSYGVKESNPYNKLFEERIIFLGVQIDDASANDVMAQLLCWSPRTPIVRSACTSTRPAGRSRR